MVSEPDNETPDPEAGSLADALVAALGAEGRVEAEGRFTLDRDRAQQKLAGFQLPDPHEYVLMLVQCAVRQGATRIGCRFKHGKIEIAFDGKPFRIADIENLQQELLSAESDDPAQRHGRRELAVALNTATELNPRRFEVNSAGNLWIRKRGREPQTRSGNVPRGAVTRVVIHKGLRGALHRLMPGGVHPEETLIRTRCTAVQIPLMVDREVVLGGLRLGEAVAREEIDHEQYAGLVGFQPLGAAPPELRIVRDGVWIHSMDLDLPTPGFVALVRADRLRVDLSRFGVLKDERWDELESVVLDAWERSVLKLERFATRSASNWHGAKPWARDLLRAVISAYAAEELARGAEVSEFARRLARLRIWTTTLTARSAAKGLSLQDLLDAAAQLGRIPWLAYADEWRVAGWQKPLEQVDAPLCLCVDEPSDTQLLERLMPGVLVPLHQVDPHVGQLMQDRIAALHRRG